LLVVTSGCASPAKQFNQKGVTAFNQGQYGVAREEFLQAANRDPLDADAFYNLGSTYHRLGQRTDAEWQYTHCLALDPKHSKCHHALAVLLLEQNRPDEAHALVRRWIGNAPGSPDPLVELAWLEKQSGRSEEAYRDLQQAIALDPRHTRALAELASLYENSNQNDRALVLYQRALTANPDHPELARKVAELRGSSTVTPSRSSQQPSVIAKNPAPGPTQSARDLRYEYRQ
jgi:tetratricopeptide (TPR) repeat protein